MTRYLPGLALVLAASLCPTTGQAQSQAPSRDQTTYLDFQVEQPAKVKTVKTPVYPDHLRASQVEGRVLVQFVVDERGRPDMSSFKVIKSSDAALTESVRQAVSGTSFFPAEAGGQKVKQLVQLPFAFTPTSK